MDSVNGVIVFLSQYALPAYLLMVGTLIVTRLMLPYLKGQARRIAIRIIEDIGNVDA